MHLRAGDYQQQKQISRVCTNMYLLNKYPHPVNFTFAGSATADTLTFGARTFRYGIDSRPEGITRIGITDPGLWPRQYDAGIGTEWNSDHDCESVPLEAKFDTGGGLKISGHRGCVILESSAEGAVGVKGHSWLFRFRRDPSMRFYGMGEKAAPFEKSGRCYLFWNTDAWADFYGKQIESDYYDPAYCSIPWLILKNGAHFYGLCIDSPWPSFIGLSPPLTVSNQMDAAGGGEPFFYLGAENGPPSLYILDGPTLPALIQKFAMCTGTTPLPPLWALGYHQSRWGYTGSRDLEEVAAKCRSNSIPVDGIWLDIDYMDAYKVFTVHPEHFDNPGKTVAQLNRHGIHVVPILDPGIKKDPDYFVYNDGIRDDIFCKNETGDNFTGIVWPGYTVFPDFTLDSARTFWAHRVRSFMEHGFSGFWLDMNDPSTGSVPCTSMRFEKGCTAHDAFHNTYATRMAEATREGCIMHAPDTRPFLISRSGSTGIQRFSAVWTGDSVSNYFSLRLTVSMCLSLSVSGVVFCGGDAGGFGGDTTAALCIDWHKACFLFPFFRNHSCRGTRRQEPWAFSASTLRIIRFYIRLRYRFIPYLYTLFAETENTGAPVLRPLMYDFETGTERYEQLSDQFMIGPSVMQAPFMDETMRTREVVLPPGRWYRADTHEWHDGGGSITVHRERIRTPLFFREGAIIPLRPGMCSDNSTDLRSILLFIVLDRSSRTPGALDYVADDGVSTGYRKGKRTRVRCIAQAEDETCRLQTESIHSGYGHISITPVTPGPVHFERMIVEQRAPNDAFHIRSSLKRVNYFGTTAQMCFWERREITTGS
jgi:alpha-glucosidase